MLCPSCIAEAEERNVRLLSFATTHNILYGLIIAFVILRQPGVEGALIIRQLTG